MFITYILSSEHQPRLFEFSNEQIRPNSFIIVVCILLDGDKQQTNKSRNMYMSGCIKMKSDTGTELSVKREEIHVNAQTV